MSSTTFAKSNGANNNVKYGELAKPINEFFTKDFPSGTIKFEAKTSSAKGPIFSSVAKGNVDTFSDEFKLSTVKDLTSGGVEAEVKNTSSIALLKDALNAKIVLTLNSNNTISETLTFHNPAYEGFKVELGGSLATAKSPKAHAGFELNQGPILVTSKTDLLNGPIVRGDAVTRYKDLLIGAEVSYDVASAQLNEYSASIALDRPREKAIVQVLTGGKSFNVAYHSRFADNLELAAKTFWGGSASAMAMEVGAKYYSNGGGFFKGKIDNTGRLGLAVASDLRPGMQLILGASIDTNKLSENNHSFGLQLNYSA